MAAFKIENLSFSYPSRDNKVLNNINLDIDSGEFILIFGRSGSGKTTLLRHLKPQLTPHGKRDGDILFFGQSLEDVDFRMQSHLIGYVMQDVESQIVTDKVWHELAFGLESLGCDNQIIRLRVAEVADFFDIEDWFHKKTTELSGGQKQLLNLASIMAMQPKVLILDEPTSQLDPIMAVNFLEIVKKINNELGVTVILSEHRLEEVFSFADRVILLEDGEIAYNGKPNKINEFLYERSHSLSVAMPTPIRIYSAFEDAGECPVDLKSGRKWLESKLSINNEKNLELIYTSSVNSSLDKKNLTKNNSSNNNLLNNNLSNKNIAVKSSSSKSTNLNELFNKSNLAIQLSEVWFRYTKHSNDVIRDINLEVPSGSWYSVLGANGSGKTSLLKIICGIENYYRGQYKLFGKPFNKYKTAKLQGNLVSMLPQNPQTLFVAKTLKLDLENLLKINKIDKDKWDYKIAEVLEITELQDLINSHPYDLSGGEQQRAALAKILLLNPRLILLDEPTKGLDGFYKLKFAKIIKQLLSNGTTVLMVSHDIEFVAKNSDYCGMLFDGNIISSGTNRKFFEGNSFYTTSANRMCRNIFSDVLLAEDAIDKIKNNII